MKKAIVVVSFGVGDAGVRQSCIDSIAEDISRAFPEHAVRQAFTSVFIRRRLAAEGITVDSLPDALAKLQQQGFAEVIVQPTHLTPGEEYDNKIVAAIQEAQDSFPCLLLARPAFFFAGNDGPVDDYLLGLMALRSQLADLADGEEAVFMGHGSPHRHNPVYEILQQRADAMKLPLTVGVLEPSDTPNVDAVIERLQKRNCRRVRLMPLLLAGGSHVARDMAGEEASSWQSRLLAAGFAVRVHLAGLGENAAFRQIYVQHIRDVLNEKN